MYRGPQLAESVESGLGPEEGPKPGACSGRAMGRRRTTLPGPYWDPHCGTMFLKASPNLLGRNGLYASGKLPVTFRYASGSPADISVKTKTATMALSRLTESSPSSDYGANKLFLQHSTSYDDYRNT
jgi:hypothetical protein